MVKMSNAIMNLFKFRTTPRNDFSKIRALVKEDLYNALVESNRRLQKQFHLKSGILKSNSELNDIVYNTEETMFNLNTDIQEYFETVTVFLIFLRDKQLSEDALLFRFLINIDLDDLYMNPETHEIIFSDLVYCNGDPIQKRHLFKNIIQQIQRRVQDVSDAYMNGKHCSFISPISYYIDSQLKKDMDNYRQSQLARIMQELNTHFDLSLENDIHIPSVKEKTIRDPSFAGLSNLFKSPSRKSIEYKYIENGSKPFRLDDHSSSSSRSSSDHDDSDYSTINEEDYDNYSSYHEKSVKPSDTENSENSESEVDSENTENSENSESEVDSENTESEVDSENTESEVDTGNQMGEPTVTEPSVYVDIGEPAVTEPSVYVDIGEPTVTEPSEYVDIGEPTVTEPSEYVDTGNDSENVSFAPSFAPSHTPTSSHHSPVFQEPIQNLALGHVISSVLAPTEEVMVPRSPFSEKAKITLEDLQELKKDIIETLKKELSPPRTSSPLITVEEEFVEMEDDTCDRKNYDFRSIKCCTTCAASLNPKNTSYRTIILNENDLSIEEVGLCGKRCMEKWRPVKLSKMKNDKKKQLKALFDLV